MKNSEFPSFLSFLSFYNTTDSEKSQILQFLKFLSFSLTFDTMRAKTAKNLNLSPLYREAKYI